ncbi:benzyl alcohol O-benzoyltransferase-like [Coffea arabica]|uniref:Benzyl alcohol O-benzoyltransferase-like n=1 Tax=Coffea arabica TaxID=13443 RepID=A0A6P6SV76_COFAR|nr:benzyl alcohol O-benzoyltransferase-like [Coffea arabica]
MGSVSASSKTLTFRVTRQKPELVRPAKSTPRECKLLSDIDDQEALRIQIPFIQVYRNRDDPGINESRRRSDPVKVIREAIAKALVFYYPLAGRLREGPGRKLMVECTGEGVLFIEADADVTLEQFGDAIQPPFPCLEELLYDVPHSGGILHCPIVLIQVTRLRCGGFIFALRMNHTIADGVGIAQFMNAVGEIARGASAPSIQPVWQRELLYARDPPRVTCTHHEYEEVVVDTKGTIVPLDDMVHRSFFFGPAEVSALRKSIPLDLSHKCSTFDILTAFLWRCQTIALQYDPNEEVRVICIVNARFKFNPPLPQGYYGNAIAYPTALTTAGQLCEKPVGYAVELVTKAKRVVTEDYMKSVADLMVIKGRPRVTLVRTYLASDVTRAGLNEADFGWGKPVYGGPAEGTVASFHIPFKNKKGETGRVVPIFLPGLAMDRFVNELENFFLSHNVRPHFRRTTSRL